MPAKFEYRVVWKRKGMHQKSKRFQHLKAAERRVTLLGPEPWLAFNEDPDERYCCSGFECGCRGVTWRQHLLDQRKQSFDPDGSGMPPIEYIRIERRELPPWESLPSVSAVQPESPK